MTRGGAPPPTRHNLLRARRRLERVARGADLLTRKRRALVGELFELAAPAVSAREQLLQRAETAYPALLSALGRHGAAELRRLGWPARVVEVETRTARIWGIGVAEILRRSPVRRSLAARGTPPGGTGPTAIQAADEFEELIELLLDAASRESMIRRLGEALARTSRQLNTLERRVGPELERQIGATRRVLEEREREEHVRVRLLTRRHRGRSRV